MKRQPLITASKRDRRARAAQDGFTLIAALVATLVLTSGLLTMAQLINIAVATNTTSKTLTMTTILADQKLEELRSVGGLQLSPADAIQRSSAGFVDHVDGFGVVVGTGTPPPRGAVYTRRWTIVPLATDPDRLVVRVRVTPIRHDREGNARVSGEARAFTIKGAH